jgi:TonB-dependent starch-binding outer membrane protein SusC
MKQFFSKAFLLIIFFFILSMAYGQTTVKVRGTVTDKDGQTLVGATVTIKGTQIGTVTDIDGKFEIVVPSEQNELIISFIGYLSETITINKQQGAEQSIAVTLWPTMETLSEVVVIGYGTVKKEDLTGSVSVVTAEELTRTPIPNVSRAIQGRASGVVVYQSGEPGGGVNMRVRGIGSITRDPDPLFVVDGIVGVDINSISPEDIESVSVLKDASSAAIYGANAANGVIVITTKRGVKSQTPRISFSSSLATSRAPNRFDLMNADEYAAFYNEVNRLNNTASHEAYSDNFRQQYFQGDWRKGTDWQDEILQQNLTQNYFLNISQGGEISNYSLSFNYLDEEGLLINSKSDRFNIRAVSDFRLNEFIKVGETISITRKTHKSPNNSAWGMALESTPLMNIFNPNNKEGYEGTQIIFQYDTEQGQTATALNTGGNDKFNPVGILSIPDNNRVNDDILADVYLEIKPLQNLTFTTTGTARAFFSESHSWQPSYNMGTRSETSTRLSQSNSRGQSFTLKNQIAYTVSIGRHFIDATAVHDASRSSSRNISGTASGFPYEQLAVISQGIEKDLGGGEYEGARLSYLGRVIYNFDSKYLFSASVRHDGSPNFIKGRRWGTFPAFSAAWKINEDFLKNINEIDMLKVRFGWGKTGNSNVGSFAYTTRIGSPTYFRPVFGLSPTQAYALNEDIWSPPGNPYIQWEAAEMTNFGLDLNAFNNRIQFSAEYYIKNQDNLIMKVPISLIHGKGVNWNPGSPEVNIAAIQNKGFEFDLRYNKMEGQFRYKFFANLSTVDNKVVSIPSSIIGNNNITMVGYPIGSIFGYVAERIIQESDFDNEGNYLHEMPATGKPMPGDLKFADINGDEVINDKDRTIIGKPIPDYTYSFGAEWNYRIFDFSVFFYGIQNAQILNTMRSRVESFRTQDMDHNKSAEWAANYYGKDGKPSTQYVRADRNDSNLNSRSSSWWVDEASFLRLKDIQIGVTIPRTMLQNTGINNIRIYVSGMNLYTFTKYEGYDPESPLNSDQPTAPAVDHNKYPMPRTFTAGIQMSL